MIIVWLYFVFLLIRPQEAFPALSGASLGPPLLVAAAAHWVFSGKDFRAPQLRLMIFFYLATLLSLVVAGASGMLGDWYFNFGKTLAFFLFLSNVSSSVHRLRFFLFTLLGCSVLIALHGIHQHYNGGIGITGIEAEHGRITWVGFYQDPNDLGVLLVCALPIAVYFVFHNPVGSRWLALPSIPALLYAIYLTDSRGALVATMALGGIAGLQKLGVIRTMLLGLPLLLAVLSLDTRLDTISVQESSAQGRVYAWYAGFLMFFDSPLTGVGAQQFTAYHGLTAHNAFVLVLAETGLIGYLLYLTLLISTVSICYWLARQKKRISDDEEARQLCDLGSLLTLVLLSWTISAFFLSITYYWTIYTILALCAGLYTAAQENSTLGGEVREKTTWARWISLAALSLPALYVATSVLNRIL